MTAQNRFAILYSFPTQFIFQALALVTDILLIYYFLLSFDEIVKLEGFIKIRLKEKYSPFLRTALALVVSKLFLLQAISHVLVLNFDINSSVSFVFLIRILFYLSLAPFINKLPFKYLLFVGMVWLTIPRIFVATFWLV